MHRRPLFLYHADFRREIVQCSSNASSTMYCRMNKINFPQFNAIFPSQNGNIWFKRYEIVLRLKRSSRWRNSSGNFVQSLLKIENLMKAAAQTPTTDITDAIEMQRKILIWSNILKIGNRIDMIGELVELADCHRWSLTLFLDNCSKNYMSRCECHNSLFIFDSSSLFVNSLSFP